MNQTTRSLRRTGPSRLEAGSPAFEISLADIMHDIDPPAAQRMGTVAPRSVEPASVKRETGPPPSRFSRRWFARLWSWLDDGIDATVAPLKEAVYRDLPDRIVEIGPGRGSNFKRYAKGTKVIAFEPNQFMHDDLRAAAAEHGIELDLRSSGVEEMPLADQSQDAVVATFTLCSVADPDVAIDEIWRILKPGGRFLFIEHIAAESGTALARAQAVLRRPWAIVADRCDLMATTDRAIERSRFTEVHSETRSVGPKVDPSRRTIFGTAVR